MPTSVLDLITPELVNSLTKDELKEFMKFSEFLEALMVVEGKKGSGKTQLGVAILHKLKKYFKIPIVTDQKLKSAFGEYFYLNERDFIGEIEKVSEISRGTSQDDVDLAVGWSLKKQGVILEGAAILLDEAYKYFDCRTPSDKLVRVFGYFIAQMRHYHATVILCCPSRRYLDRRVRDQIDILAKVAYNKRTETVHARFLNYTTGETSALRVYGPNYRDFYDSWNPIAIRHKVLDIRGSL